MRIELWDQKTNVLLQSGMYTPEMMFADPLFAFTKYVPTVLTYAPGTDMVVGIDNLGIIRMNNDIDESLSDEEALAEYVHILESAPRAHRGYAADTSLQDDMKLLMLQLVETELAIKEAKSDD